MEDIKRKKAGGRAKGTPNKVTTTIREKLKQALEIEIDNLPAILSDLEPEKRIKAIVDLLQYALPKATEEIVNENKTKPSSFMDMVKKQFHEGANY